MALSKMPHRVFPREQMQEDLSSAEVPEQRGAEDVAGPSRYKLRPSEHTATWVFQIKLAAPAAHTRRPPMMEEQKSFLQEEK